MIALENISKNYGATLALKNISLEIKAGKIYGLLGPNGSGKSTLIKIILKILSPTTGEIKFLNDSLVKDFYNSIGYLPEERGLFLNSPVYEVLSYFGELKNLHGKELKEKIFFWLEKLSLADSAKLLVGQLSKGNRQKVQLITAIMHEPVLLILDEPYTGFDPVNQQLLNEIISGYSNNERTVILSTHLMNFVENVCTDVIFLHNGNLIFNGELKNLLAKHSQDIYVIEIEKEQTRKEELEKLNFKRLTEKHPPLNEIFLQELNGEKENAQ